VNIGPKEKTSEQTPTTLRRRPHAEKRPRAVTGPTLNPWDAAKEEDMHVTHAPVSIKTRKERKLKMGKRMSTTIRDAASHTNVERN
jgi:hypothetical protein